MFHMRETCCFACLITAGDYTRLIVPPFASFPDVPQRFNICRYGRLSVEHNAILRAMSA